MKRRVWLGFLLFCMLSSAEWLVPPSASDSLPALERQGLLFGVVGLAAGLFAVLRGGATSRRVLRPAHLMAGGVGFFGLTAVFFEWSAGSLTDVNRVAGLAAVPAVVVMIVAFTSTEGARRLLIPALAGLGGALLLLPVGLSTATRGRIVLAGFIAVVVLVAVLSVWLHRLIEGVALADAIAVVCLSNAAFLLAFSFVSGRSVWHWSALEPIAFVPLLFEAAEMVLMIWLLREMPPVRFAARYLVVPLFTVVEGYVVLRLDMTVRMGFGMALLAAAAGIILFSQESENEANLSLR